ncbi:MAG: hypothetical protein K6G83_14365 [Lachnospiraceae bacterium]|nr:hypothetical protein [Lachnospiraceae bacterium]
MKRENAVVLSKIYNLQKERNRGIYPEELASFRITSRGSCRLTVNELLQDGMLEESVANGASVFTVSNKGFYEMQAYLDIRRELAV